MFADDSIRTVDLWYLKRLLYQLSHTTSALFGSKMLQIFEAYDDTVSLVLTASHILNGTSPASFLFVFMISNKHYNFYINYL